MDINPADSSNDEHQKKEKEKRDRREKADASGQRPGLKFFRHHHANLVSREQVRLVPMKVPARSSLAFFTGRESVIRKVNIFEVRGHPEIKVADLGHLLAKLVLPPVQPLRLVTGPEFCNLPRRHMNTRVDGVFLVFRGYRNTVQLEPEIIVKGLLRGKRQRQRYFLVFVAGVAEAVFGLEIDLVRRVPQQSLLPMLEEERGVRARGLEWEQYGFLDLHRFGDGLVELLHVARFPSASLIRGGRRQLRLRRSPVCSHAGTKTFVHPIRPRENG